MKTVKQQISRFFKDPTYFSRTFKALNFDFQIQGLSRTFKVRPNPVGIKRWQAFQLSTTLAIVPETSLLFQTMSDKSIETLGSKIRFSAFWKHFPPFPKNKVDFFVFFDCTDYSAHATLNWGTGGIRDLTLDANKLERMIKYRKSYFPKSVSTTFVAHCSHRGRSRNTVSSLAMHIIASSCFMQQPATADKHQPDGPLVGLSVYLTFPYQSCNLFIIIHAFDH